MKVYKKDIYEFLEKVEAKAVKSVQKKYGDKIRQSKVERTQGYLKQIRDFINTVEAIHGKAEDLYKEYSDLYSRANWSNLYYMKYYLESVMSNGNSISAMDVQDNAYEKELKLELNEQLDSVKKEYAKLTHYAKNNSAKETYNLLKELGFDVSSLERTDKALIETADKSKLFVCGENK